MAKVLLGSYELLATVATDAYTITYRARTPARGPLVLVKTAKSGIANRAVASLLEAEAERLQRLGHPALGVVIEQCEVDGAPLLVLVDRGGVRLSAVLERRAQLDADSAIAIGIELAAAVGALHRDGAVHGALHPSLIELTEQGGVYLHGAGELGPIAGLRRALESPEHLAPEQVVGELGEPRSDVFLFGVLFYRMLAGRGAFDGTPEGITQRIRHAPAAPLMLGQSARDRALSPIVDRCLAKRPLDRFGDMASVAGRLTQALRMSTSLPADELVARALADAGLCEARAAPLDRGADRGTAILGFAPRRLLVAGGVAVGAAVLALTAWVGLDRGALGPSGSPRGILEQPAGLRVLARPWAEVHVDGKHLETTPFARPIAITPGRHRVTFRHPNAPDELRTIEAVGGQTLVLDVEMSVVQPRGAASAAASAQPDDP
ncbi:MAG: hypothetical protein EXR75_04350 [Myxococcales bacterium]|nr:hypothetical protein [Myxococcales bacterium]